MGDRGALCSCESRSPGPQALRGRPWAPASAGAPSRACEGGFTLIEMLVALAVFSLAALALLRLQGVTLSTTADLDQKLMGQIVARNMAVELLSDPAPPSLGKKDGTAENGGRQWHWTRDAEITDDPRIMKVDIRVVGTQGGSPTVLTIVRPVK